MKRLSMALGLALCVALPASAQMYKWVDSDGKVQYSDKPPPSNIKTEKLREPARAASTPAASDAKGGTPKDAAKACLLYTSDAADDLLCVDLGGRRIIKK